MSLTPGVVWKERRERSEDAASCVPSSAAYMKGKLRPVVSLGSLPFESWLIVSPHPCQVGCILDILTMVFMDVWIFEAVSCHSLSTAGLGLFGCAGTGLQVQHACWVHLSGRGAGCRPVLAAESHVRGPHSIWDRVEDNGCHWAV